jgi:hypothetical protein
MVAALVEFYSSMSTSGVGWSGVGEWAGQPWGSGEPCVDNWIGTTCCIDTLPMFDFDSRTCFARDGSASEPPPEGNLSFPQGGCRSGTHWGNNSDEARCTVVDLDLRSVKGVSGSLAALESLCGLNHLQGIDLTETPGLVGAELPATMPSPCLSSLQRLRLSGLGLKGGLPSWLGRVIRASAQNQGYSFGECTGCINLDLRDNNFTYEQNSVETLIEVCKQSVEVSCDGIPPRSCSAFGEAYLLSTANPLECITCNTEEHLVAVLFLTLTFLVVLLLFFSYVRAIRRHPQALKKWVTTVSICIGHFQTISIIGFLQLNWPPGVKTFAGILSLSLNDINVIRPECLFDQSRGINSVEGGPFLVFSVFQIVVIIVLLLSTLLLVSLPLSHSFVDHVWFGQTILLQCILSLSWRIAFKLAELAFTYDAARVSLLVVIALLGLEAGLVVLYFRCVSYLKRTEGEDGDDLAPMLAPSLKAMPILQAFTLSRARARTVANLKGAFVQRGSSKAASPGGATGGEESAGELTPDVQTAAGAGPEVPAALPPGSVRAPGTEAASERHGSDHVDGESDGDVKAAAGSFNAARKVFIQLEEGGHGRGGGAAAVVHERGCGGDGGVHATASPHHTPSRRERLKIRMKFMIGRFGAHAPYWQFVLWGRQLLLTLDYTIPRLYLSYDRCILGGVSISNGTLPYEGADSECEEKQMAVVMTHAILALLILLISRWLQARVLPFEYAFQNKLEHFLLVSDIVLVFFGTVYTAASASSALGGLLVAILVGSLICALAYLAYVYFHPQSSKELTEEEEHERRLTSESSRHPLGRRALEMWWLASIGAIRPGRDELLDGQGHSSARSEGAPAHKSHINSRRLPPVLRRFQTEQLPPRPRPEDADPRDSHCEQARL